MCMFVGMDILGHLCQVEQNETLLAENLDTIVYENIVRMLTLHDIQLIVFTLETLYQLSELGELASTCIAHARTAVGELACLVLSSARSCPSGICSGRLHRLDGL